MEQYKRAWPIKADIPGAPGQAVLVECGKPSDPYWWVLCPAAATLLINLNYGAGCSDASCMWEDVHEEAERMLRRRAEGSA